MEGIESPCTLAIILLQDLLWLEGWLGESGRGCVMPSCCAVHTLLLFNRSTVKRCGGLHWVVVAPSRQGHRPDRINATLRKATTWNVMSSEDIIDSSIVEEWWLLNSIARETLIKYWIGKVKRETSRNLLSNESQPGAVNRQDQKTHTYTRRMLAVARNLVTEHHGLREGPRLFRQ